MLDVRLERLARGKRSSLIQKLVNYDLKKFYNVDTWVTSGGRDDCDFAMLNRTALIAHVNGA